MSRPAEIWNAERLERAMLDEAAGHGANKQDLSLLSAEFRRLRANNDPDNQNQPEQIEIAGEIPE
jgi:hypothetical protein